MNRAYFTRGDDGLFVGTDLARGPWDPDACHGGPPTALLIRAIERLDDVRDDQQLARMTVELSRPVPMAGVHARAEIVHTGRTVTRTRADLVDVNGRVCASALGMHLARAEAPTPSAPIDAPVFADAVAGPFPVPDDLHDGLEFFVHSTEVRWDGDGADRLGPGTLWMRTVPIVAGEQPSPLQRIGPLADCGNGISFNAPPDQISFINPDLTVTFLRPPTSDWLASRSSTHTTDHGIGVAEAHLFDRDGLVATASQTLVIRPAAR